MSQGNQVLAVQGIHVVWPDFHHTCFKLHPAYEIEHTSKPVRENYEHKHCLQHAPRASGGTLVEYLENATDAEQAGDLEQAEQ